MADYNNNIATALQAAEVGFPVFPANPENKRPLIKDWPNLASRDPNQIRTWWSQFPRAMTGAVTGDASGFFVLDIDVKNGEDAFEKLKNLQRLYGEFSSTLMVKTASGGLHLYFKMPDGINLRNSAGKLATGVDIRANGGYVIFPGSIRADGQSYKILDKGL